MAFNPLKAGKSTVSPHSYKPFHLAFICLIFYFIWMDIALYVNLQRWSPPPIQHKTPANLTTLSAHQQTTPPPKIDPFSTFNPLTCKLIMVDHMTHYVHDILARFLIDYIGLARLFPWVTANLVSLAGVFLAIVGSKLTVSDSLMHRQMGAVLFECRNLADSLDGVFARSHKREQAISRHSEKTAEITYSSTYGSIGYNVDIICDIIGGAFFCAAIFYRFLRRKPAKSSSSSNDFKYSKLENESESRSDYLMVKIQSDGGGDVSSQVKQAFNLYPGASTPASSPRHFSSRQVKLIVISFGMRILLTGGLWDNFVHKYHDLLEVYSSNPVIRHQQGVAFRSPLIKSKRNLAPFVFTIQAVIFISVVLYQWLRQ